MNLRAGTDSMEKIKPWQIVLIVVAAAVLGFSVWKQMSKPSVELPNSVIVVDVATGELYRMKLGKRNGAYFPERHPDTGKLSLMPVEKNDSGDWYIVEHAMPALEDINDKNNVVNASTGRVTIESEKILSTLSAGG